MRATIVLVLFSFLSFSLIGQTSNEYSSRTAHLQIKSSNSVSEVEANNYQVYSSINFEEKTISFVGLMSAWEFELGAIDRAFNSDRINLADYPKFTYDGKIKGKSKFKKPGRYELNVRGFLYIRRWKH